MKPAQLLTLIATFILLVGCGEQPAELTAPQSHRSDYLSFDYPGNWEITTDAEDDTLLNVIIETPGDALVILQAFPLEFADSLVEFVEEFSTNAKDAVPIGEVADSDLTESPEDGNYTWIQEQFSIELLGQSVPHQRLYGSKDNADKRLYLILQAATEDWAKVKPGFDLIADTLELKAAERPDPTPPSPDVNPQAKQSSSQL